MNKPRVWMLGDWQQPEFDPAMAYLRRKTNLRPLHSDIRGPGLIVLAASRPGRFSAAEVASIHRQAPQARLVALLGSWCEGEVRSGHPWPGVTRIYAHQWQARLPQELAPLQPRTANKPPRYVIGIAAAQWTTFDALASACRSFGKDPVWLPANRPLPVQRVDAVIFDATFDLAAELARLRHLREQLHSPPTVLLLDYPRQSDLNQATQAGASSILAKPFLLADLAAEIARLTALASQRLIAAA